MKKIEGTCTETTIIEIDQIYEGSFRQGKKKLASKFCISRKLLTKDSYVPAKHPTTHGKLLYVLSHPFAMQW